MDHKREYRTLPLARVKGVGRKQQQRVCMKEIVDVFVRKKY